MFLADQEGSKENSAANEDLTIFFLVDCVAFNEFKMKARKGEINRS